MEFYIQVPVLKALLLTAGKEYAFKAINGIHVEYSKAGVLLVSTDGHRMSVARCDYDGEPFDPFIINRLHVESLKGKFFLSVKVTHEDGVTTIGDITIGDITLGPIDTAYPYWRRVIPSKLSGEPAYYNPAYYADLGKARHLLGLRKDFTGLEMNGESAALDQLTPDFFVVLMPIRRGKDFVKFRVPDWISEGGQS